MRPPRTRDDRPDRGYVYTIFGGKPSEQLGMLGANFLNVAVCKLGASVAFTDAVSPVCNIVRRVIDARSPSKIFRAIVRSVAIPVGNFMKNGWALTVERGRHKGMHFRTFDRAVTPDVNLRVSIFAERLRKYFPRVRARTGGQAAYSPQRGDFVVRRAGHCFPSFVFHGLLDTGKPSNNQGIPAEDMSKSLIAGGRA